MAIEWPSNGVGFSTRLLYSSHFGIPRHQMWGNRAANCATGFCSTCKSERFAWSAMLEESGEGPRLLYFRFLGQGMPRRRGIEQRGRAHSAMGLGSLGNGAGLARQRGLGSLGQWDLLGQWAHSAMRLGLTRRMGLTRQWGWDLLGEWGSSGEWGSLGNEAGIYSVNGTHSVNGLLGRMGGPAWRMRNGRCRVRIDPAEPALQCTCGQNACKTCSFRLL